MAADPDRPPFFKSWNRVYALVLAAFILEVIVFSLIAAVER